MAETPRREFLKLAIAGALAAVSGALDAARASAEPLGPAAPFAPENVLNMAREFAKSPFKAPRSTLPDPFNNLTFEQYTSIRRKPGSAIWGDAHGGFALEPLNRGFIFATPMELYLVEGGQSQRVVYDRNLYDFGKLQLPADLGDLGFSGVRILSGGGSEGWKDAAIFQGATFFRSLARGQSYGVSARGLSIRTGDAQGEEFPLFRALWIEKPSPAADALVIHALLDSTSLTGAFRFTLHAGDATIIDTELTLFARVAVDHLGLGSMAGMYLLGGLDHLRGDDVRQNVYDVTGLQILTGAGEWIWRPVANRETLQISAFSDQNPRGFGLLQRNRNFEFVRRRRRPLGAQALALDRTDRRLGRRRGHAARNSFRFRKQRQHHRAMASEERDQARRVGLVRLSSVLVLVAAGPLRWRNRHELAHGKGRQALALRGRIRLRPVRRPAEGGRGEPRDRCEPRSNCRDPRVSL